MERSCPSPISATTELLREFRKVLQVISEEEIEPLKDTGLI